VSLSLFRELRRKQQPFALHASRTHGALSLHRITVKSESMWENDTRTVLLASPALGTVHLFDCTPQHEVHGRQKQAVMVPYPVLSANQNDSRANAAWTSLCVPAGRVCTASAYSVCLWDMSAFHTAADDLRKRLVSGRGPGDTTVAPL
jgi:hypothetical protein